MIVNLVGPSPRGPKPVGFLHFHKLEEHRSNCDEWFEVIEDMKFYSIIPQVKFLSINVQKGCMTTL